MIVWVVVIGLAAYRLWRLAAEDSITERLRESTIDNWPEWVGKLVYCPWCLGSWIAFALTFGVDVVVGLSAPLLVGLAAAVVVGAVAEAL